MRVSFLKYGGIIDPLFKSDESIVFSEFKMFWNKITVSDFMPPRQFTGFARKNYVAEISSQNDL
jgi:hypothetical protein